MKIGSDASNYLDRVRQATMSWPREDLKFDAASEVAITNYMNMDWRYVQRRIREIPESDSAVGQAGVHRRVRSRARRANAQRDAGGMVIA